MLRTVQVLLEETGKRAAAAIEKEFTRVPQLKQ